MTREEFIKQRCEIDKITEEEFEKRYRVVKCNCGQPYCKGYRCLDLDGLLKENQELKKQLEVGEQQYNDLVEEKEKLEERISYLERSIERKEETITELELERVPYTNEYIDKINKKNEDLKRQLEYLRSGEYYNQLRFVNKMLQDIVDNGEVSKEDREFIDCTHRNTELLEQQQVFIDYLEDMLDNDNDIFSVIRVKDVLNKYKEIIGTDTNVGSKGGNEDENNSI